MRNGEWVGKPMFKKNRLRFQMENFGVGIALLAFVHLSCTGENEEEKIILRLRADSVQPGENVDVAYEIDGVNHQKDGLAPGSYIELGGHDSGTVIKFKVYNVNGAGQVRANILADDCFRATAACDSLNCVAEANYIAKKEECINH